MAGTTELALTNCRFKNCSLTRIQVCNVVKGACSKKAQRLWSLKYASFSACKTDVPRNAPQKLAIPTEMCALKMLQMCGGYPNTSSNRPCRLPAEGCVESNRPRMIKYMTSKGIKTQPAVKLAQIGSVPTNDSTTRAFKKGSSKNKDACANFFR